MKTSIIEKNTFFETSIFKVELISELLRSKSSRFLAEIERWLSENQEVLKQFGFIESSRMSILRNQLFVAKAQDIPQKRRHLLMVGANCLEKAHEMLAGLHEPIRTKITQGRETIQQILTMVKEDPAYQKGANENFNQYVKNIWKRLRQDPQFGSVAMQLQTLLPEVDIYRIIAEEVEI
ncbi:hypothetical protein U8527_02755 [Kordia algicida OT-1]|uniref:Uncharacterized protein n=1 Tax=Kordia algicida OT-1 TaxID=391587 RepID=A9DNN1_9FLAO|nr:hypothetical protein [Kordia algicida]EDP97232.1 hypothetical protein KAOT1_18757 [Kordia algicida OT-1]